MTGIHQARLLLLVIFVLLLPACEKVNLKEAQVDAFMKTLYKARKSGSFYREFTLYSKKDFKMVPFHEVESSVRANIGRAGKFKSAKHLHTKISRRNQLGEGLINYMVASYEVTYERMTLLETYYFLAAEEKPKLVYMTLQL